MPESALKTGEAIGVPAGRDEGGFSGRPRPRPIGDALCALESVGPLPMPGTKSEMTSGAEEGLLAFLTSCAPSFTCGLVVGTLLDPIVML